MAEQTLTLIQGGSFLIESVSPEDVFTPEDFTEEHRMIAETAEQFIENEVVPRIDELEAKKEGVNEELLKKAAEIGLLGASIPEAYGGEGLDQISSTILAEKSGRYGSFATTLEHTPESGRCRSFTSGMSNKKRSTCQNWPAPSGSLRMP